VLRSIEIDAANFIERIARLRRPGFPWQVLHCHDRGRLCLGSACLQARMSGFFVPRQYRNGIKEHLSKYWR
jgi:hypothetical protein